MLRKPVHLLFGLFLLLGCLSCAPGIEGDSSDDSSSDEPIASPAPPPVPIPTFHKDRIDAVLKHIHQRDLLRNHGFWTIFHGILGLGPDEAMLLDPVTKKKVNAVDYIAGGGFVDGLEFVPTADGVEVTTKPGSIIGQGHQDDFVSVLVEWDFPRDRK
ncbi:MAG TPA: hypothetical protein VGX70_14010, partial [Gemmataceae bacterium]|nr:hypothetical protein [Gemmataceae bacterium]